MNSLPRVLGPWMAMAIVVGTVIGTGVFKKGRNVATNCPEFGLGISVWIVGGILVLLGALAMAEIAVRFPRAGGNYVYLREGFGRRAAFLWGWVDFWIIRSASIAVLAFMFVEFFHEMLKDLSGTKSDVIEFWFRQAATIALIIGLSIINILGTRLGGRVQLGLTILKVGSLMTIAVLPFVVLLFTSSPAHPPRVELLSPVWPTDWSAVNWGKYGGALVAVLWAYDGWMNFGNVAEEIKNPNRNIPLAAVGGVLLLILLYVAVNVAYYLVIPHADIVSLQDRPVAMEFFFRLLGPIGVAIASSIMMCSVLGALNGNVLVAPRLLFAMGKDHLASPRFSELHSVYRTPVFGTIAYGTWASLMVILGGLMTQYKLPLIAGIDLNLPEGKPLFDVLTDFALVGVVTMGTLAVAAIFPVRWRDPGLDLPYRCIGYPLVPMLYVAGMVFVLGTMFWEPEQRTEAIIGMAFIASGAVVHEWRFRSKL